MGDGRHDAFRQDLLSWAVDNLRGFPWRDADRTPFEVLLAEVLLARTPAENVDDVYQNLLDSYPAPSELASAQPDEVATRIESLGLQNKRGRALVEIASTVSNDGVPDTVSELQDLPHVGPYAAHATMCFGFDQPHPIVDTNVARIYHRVFGVPNDPDADEVWEFAERMVPDESDAAKRYNLALLDFGALVCTARGPSCGECFAVEYCPSAFDC